MNRVAHRVVALAAGALVLVASWIGFFYFRDNFATHWPVKFLSAQAFRQASIPWWNFAAGGGQPLAGNPNTLAFYPDNFLYLFFPAHVAFNLHFWIHLLLAFAAMRALVRELGAGERNATLTAVIYTMSGAVVSATAFYNLATGTALIPLALLAGERLVRWRGSADGLFLGIVCGLLALAGEPVQVMATTAALALLVVVRPAEKVRWASLVAPLGIAAAVAAVMAAPLLIAYSEIAAEVERGAYRYSAQTVLAASLPPWRFFEMLVGPFRGLITDAGAGAFRPAAGQWPPLFASLFLGVLALPALFSRAAPRRYQAIAVLMAFLALGRFNPIVSRAIESFAALRAVRYPEKLAVPLIAGLAVLIGAWLEGPRTDRDRTFLLAGSIAPLAVVALDGWHRGGAQIGATALAAILAIAAAVAAGTLVAERRDRALVILAITPLAYWAVRAAPLDRFWPYRAQPPAAAVRLADAVGGGIVLPASASSARDEYRLRFQRRDPLAGVPAGVQYALDRSPDGMYSVLSRVVQERFMSAPPALQMRYARLLGCHLILARRPLGPQAERLVIGAESLSLTAVDRPLPGAMAVERVEPVTTIQQAVRRIESPDFDEQTTAIVPAALAGIAPRLPSSLQADLREDAIELSIASPGDAIVVVNQSYFSAWSAVARDRGGHQRRLRTFPANIDRLGVAIPPGIWTVELRFGQRRQLVGAAWALSALALLASLPAVWRSRKVSAAPAR